MSTQISTVEVFAHALVMSIEERAALATQLLDSLGNGNEQERSTADQIRARFKALDAQVVVACQQRSVRSDDQDESFVPRLA